MTSDRPEDSLIVADLGNVVPRLFTSVSRHVDNVAQFRELFDLNEWTIHNWEHVEHWSTPWLFGFDRELRHVPRSIAAQTFHDMNLALVRKVKNIFENDVYAHRILREIRLLRILKGHKNIVKLKGIMRPSDPKNFRYLNLVSEYCTQNLMNVIRYNAD